MLPPLSSPPPNSVWVTTVTQTKNPGGCFGRLGLVCALRLRGEVHLIWGSVQFNNCDIRHRGVYLMLPAFGNGSDP